MRQPPKHPTPLQAYAIAIADLLVAERNVKRYPNGPRARAAVEQARATRDAARQAAQEAADGPSPRRWPPLFT